MFLGGWGKLLNVMMIQNKTYLLVFLMTGSFIVWLLMRERSLKDECTHYEYDFRFWRNIIIGLFVTVTIAYYLIELYHYLNPSQMDQMLEEFR